MHATGTQKVFESVNAAEVGPNIDVSTRGNSMESKTCTNQNGTTSATKSCRTSRKYCMYCCPYMIIPEILCLRILWNIMTYSETLWHIMTYDKISFSQFGDMFPRAAKEPALAIWQSCGVPGLKKLLRMNLLQDQGIKANRYICGSGPAKVILSAVRLTA